MDISRVAVAVVDVREEVTGRLISWQVLNTKPPGRQVCTLSVHPRSGRFGRTSVHIAVSDAGPRSSASDRRSYWRGHVKTWLGSLQAAIEGRAPWPQQEMPSAMQLAMAELPVRPRQAMEASAAVVIDAPPAVVWDAVCDPAPTRLMGLDGAAWSGSVPGTPSRELGEMQYFVTRHPGGRVTAAVCLVTELADGSRAVTRQFATAHELVYVITPGPGGTRLELTERCLGATRERPSGRELLEEMQARTQQKAERYRTVIEGPPLAGNAKGG